MIWYKDNKVITVGNFTSNFTTDEVTSLLVIDNFQPSDQATYKCVATNIYNNTAETSSRIGKVFIGSSFFKSIKCCCAILDLWVTGCAF